MRQRPNVVVLVLDSLRAANMSLYGYGLDTTASIDRLAANAVVYDQAISPATWTIPSHASLLTGLHVSQHRIGNMQGNRRLNRRLVTLPEALRRTGYETAAFSPNPLFSPTHGHGDGFDSFYGTESLGGRRRERIVRNLVASPTGPIRQAGLYFERLLAPRSTLRAVSRWMRIKHESHQPFFAFANLLAPHSPWVVPPSMLWRTRALNVRNLMRMDYISLKREWEYNARAATPTPAQVSMWRKLYDASIMHADAAFGRFVRQVSSWGGWDNTVLVITSDHGEMLGEHRGVVGHALVLHDHLIRVPLVVRKPGLEHGVRVRDVVQTHDLYRTILDWTGTPLDSVPDAQAAAPSLDDPPGDRVAITEDDYTDGYDILARLKRINPSLSDDAYPRSQRAARSATHKYVEYETGPGEFYDLGRDPAERENLVGAPDAHQRDQLQALQAALFEWEADQEIFPPVELEGEAGESAEVEHRLRALGYLS